MECEKLAKCLFFADKLPDMPNIAHMLKDQYCLRDKTNCARYIVSTAGLQVPINLFPNDTARAHDILLQAQAAAKG